MHIFPLIDLKYIKLTKKAKNVSLNELYLGQKYISRRGGGAKNDFQIKYTPLILVSSGKYIYIKYNIKYKIF